MSKTLAASAVIDFVADVHHQFQGRERLEGTTRMRPGLNGEQTKFPVLGKGTARKRTAPQVKLELMNAPHSRVACELADYNASDMTDIWDQAEVNFEEKSELAGVIAGGLGRRRDQIKIDAMVAAKTAGTVTKQVAATGFGPENTLNLERILAAYELLAEDEADEGMLHILVHAKDVRQALSTTKVGSADWNSLRMVQNGTMKDEVFAGFKWHVIGNRGAEGGLALAGTVRQCWAWNERAIGTGTGNLKEADISWLGDYGSWITSGFLKMGSCIIDGLGVVEMLCDEA